MFKKYGIQGLLLLSFAAACAHKSVVGLIVNPRIPATQAEVKVKGIDDGNTGFFLRVKHLAPPQNVVPGTTTYVVWLKPLIENAQLQNLGALKIDSDLQGEMKSQTPYKKFDLLVTPEKSAEIPVPLGEPMITAHVSR